MENKFKPIYKYIAILSDMITIFSLFGLRALNIITITDAQVCLFMIFLIIFTIIIYIISYLVHIKKVLNSNIEYGNNRFNELLKYTNVMQKYFKFLHANYHEKTDGKSIELRPSNLDINKTFTDDELRIIEYNEYNIKTLRK